VTDKSRKCIAITGASSGIGAALARHYAAGGFILELAGRHEKRLENVACECRDLGAQVNVTTVDVTRLEQVKNWMAEASRRQPVDIIHVNAGVTGGVGPERDFESPEDVDALITNAAGCGSGINEYSILFAGETDEADALRLAAKTKDVSTYLTTLGLVQPPELHKPIKVVYHDACHLAHAQQERDAPRTLLNAIPNLTLLEPSDWEICCGSAGIYNIEKPDVARELGDKKVTNLMSAQPDAIALGNIGCMTQIQKHLESYENPPPVLHTVQLLAEAYQNS